MINAEKWRLERLLFKDDEYHLVVDFIDTRPNIFVMFNHSGTTIYVNYNAYASPVHRHVEIKPYSYAVFARPLPISNLYVCRDDTLNGALVELWSMSGEFEPYYLQQNVTDVTINNVYENGNGVDNMPDTVSLSSNTMTDITELINQILAKQSDDNTNLTAIKTNTETVKNALTDDTLKELIGEAVREVLYDNSNTVVKTASWEYDSTGTLDVSTGAYVSGYNYASEIKWNGIRVINNYSDVELNVTVQISPNGECLEFNLEPNAMLADLIVPIYNLWIYKPSPHQKVTLPVVLIK